MKSNLSRSLAVILVVLLSFLTLSIPTGNCQIEDSWTELTPMQEKRGDYGVATVDGKIYAIGGFNGVPLSIMEEYDPATDTWTRKSDMPTPRYQVRTEAVDGKIYAIGGWDVFPDPNATICSTVEEYDPKTDTWEKGPSMNIPRSTLAAVATPDGKIYAIGGTDVGAYSIKEDLNFFLPKKLEFYTGKVQNTVEVLDINIQ